MNSELYNLEIERSVIWWCMLDGDQLAVTLPLLDPDDFFDRRHTLIWRALSGCTLRDPYSVFQALGVDGPQVGWDYMIDIDTKAVGSPASVPHYAATLLDLAQVRRTFSCLHHLCQTASSTAAAQWLESVDAFSARPKVGKPDDGESLSAVVARVWDEYHAAPANVRADVTPSGISWFDKLLGSGLVSAMHVIAARPGQGKTAFATQIGVGIARQQIGDVLFFCCEMPNFTQAQRMVAQQGPDLTPLKDRALDVAGYEDLRNSMDDLGPLRNFKMFDAAAVTVERIRAIAMRTANRGKVAAIIVDYYQLIRTTAKMERRLDALVHISIELATLARTVNAPVIVLAQLNRAVETDKRLPLLSDLADCSQLEKDAHTVIFPYLPAKMGASQDHGEAIVIVAKNRGGPTGKTGAGDVRWEGKRVRFEGGF